MGTAVSTDDAVAKDPGTPLVVGNPDHWQLLSKFVSGDKSVVKSTKAMQTIGGCLVQVSTKECGSVAEALSYVPGVKITSDVNGGRMLVAIG